MQHVNILVSAQAADSLQSGLAALPDSQRYRLTVFEHADEQALVQVDAALVSRDITAASTKHVLADFTARYSDALRSASRLKSVHLHSSALDRPIFGVLQARGVSVTPSSVEHAPHVAHNTVAT